MIMIAMMMIIMMMMMIFDDNDSDDDDNLSKHPVGSIAHVRRDGELGPLAFRHLGDTLVPAGNHLLPSNVELEWLASVSRAVDLATVLEGEDIVAGDLLACLRERGPVSRLQGLDVNAHDDDLKCKSVLRCRSNSTASSSSSSHR